MILLGCRQCCEVVAVQDFRTCLPTTEQYRPNQLGCRPDAPTFDSVPKLRFQCVLFVYKGVKSRESGAIVAGSNHGIMLFSSWTIDPTVPVRCLRTITSTGLQHLHRTGCLNHPRTMDVIHNAFDPLADHVEPDG